jgi:hypothetical protein
MIAGILRLDLQIVVIVIAVFWLIPIWAIIDAATQSREAFAAAGSSKVLWIVLMAVLVVFVAPIAFIVALFYLFSVRPRVNRSTTL